MSEREGTTPAPATSAAEPRFGPAGWRAEGFAGGVFGWVGGSARQFLCDAEADAIAMEGDDGITEVRIRTLELGNEFLGIRESEREAAALRASAPVGEREGASELLRRLDGFVEDAGARADYPRAWVGRLVTFLDGPVRASLLGTDRRRALVLDVLYQAAERDATELAEDYETIAEAYQKASLEVGEWRRAALQARADLLAAPVDLGLPADTAWVEWSSQANTIRMIDRLAEGGVSTRALIALAMQDKGASTYDLEYAEALLRSNGWLPPEERAAEHEIHGLCPGHPIANDPAATCPVCNMSRVTFDKLRAALRAEPPRDEPEPEWWVVESNVDGEWQALGVPFSTLKGATAGAKMFPESRIVPLYRADGGGR